MKGGELINIQFSEEEKRELHYPRYYNPRSASAGEDESSMVEKPEIPSFPHQEICLDAGVSNKAFVTYFHQNEESGIERLKELLLYRPCGAITPYRTTIEITSVRLKHE